jgi:glycosyltransferase involved in cell wall biosynthesis
MSCPHSFSDLLRLVILLPVYCDWENVSSLCRQIDQQLENVERINTYVMIVDDGSPKGLSGWTPFEPAHIKRVDAVQLRRNMGHQRAIAVGLCMIRDEIECDAIVVMDADGEDRPEDVVRLIGSFRNRPECIVFAERSRRVEGTVFRLAYRVYRRLARTLTGFSIRGGNFSILPHSALDRLANMPQLWNHYTGAVYRSCLERTAIPAERGHRFGGRSSMNFLTLVFHGLCAIFTFDDLVAMRLLIASIVSVCTVIVAFCIMLAVSVAKPSIIPAWILFMTGMLILLMAQFGFLSFSLVFSLITARLNNVFIPARDYRLFIARVKTLWSSPD